MTKSSMLHVDENIGGRHDQKNNCLRTKTIAVGLLMMVGCFVVGYFSATTTNNNTTTAHTRVSSPNDDGMVSNLQHYPYVTITNKTPYATNRYLPSIGGHQLLDDKTYVKYATHFCSNDYIQEIIVSGGTWTASSRGACLVTKIEATLTRPNGGSWECDSYRSSGTSYSQFSIIMGYGDDGCCVLSSHETQWYP